MLINYFFRQRKRKCLIFLAGLVAMVMLISVTMVAKIQELETEMTGDREVGDYLSHQQLGPYLDAEKEYLRVKGSNVVRETLAIADDYSDVANVDMSDNWQKVDVKNGSNSPNRTTALNYKKSVLHAVFNYQREKVIRRPGNTRQTEAVRGDYTRQNKQSSLNVVHASAQTYDEDNKVIEKGRDNKVIDELVIAGGKYDLYKVGRSQDGIPPVNSYSRDGEDNKVIDDVKASESYRAPFHKVIDGVKASESYRAPFHKVTDDHGNMLFVIQDHSERKSHQDIDNQIYDGVKRMVNTGDSNNVKADFDGSEAVKENYYNENPVFNEGDFDPLPIGYGENEYDSKHNEQASKKFKFLFDNTKIDNKNTNVQIENRDKLKQLDNYKKIEHIVNGESVNEQRVNGESVNGQSVNGQSVNRPNSVNSLIENLAGGYKKHNAGHNNIVKNSISQNVNNEFNEKEKSHHQGSPQTISDRHKLPASPSSSPSSTAKLGKSVNSLQQSLTRNIAGSSLQPGLASNDSSVQSVEIWNQFVGANVARGIINSNMDYMRENGGAAIANVVNNVVKKAGVVIEKTFIDSRGNPPSVNNGIYDNPPAANLSPEAISNLNGLVPDSDDKYPPPETNNYDNPPLNELPGLNKYNSINNPSLEKTNSRLNNKLRTHHSLLLDKIHARINVDIAKSKVISGVNTNDALRPRGQVYSSQNSNVTINIFHGDFGDKIETQIPIQDGFDNLVAMEYPATQLQHPELSRQQKMVTVVNNQGMPVVVDKIYWSPEALSLVPPGISESTFQQYLTNVSLQPITRLEAPSWRRCGRPKNQVATLSGGQVMCARYRENHSRMVQGELLSFHLSRFLGFDNIPPVVLATVDSNAPIWKDVNDQFSLAGWQEETIVALIMWIYEIDPGNHAYHPNSKMPTVILEALEHNSSMTSKSPELTSLSANQLSEIVQWTDLILFDYITGNYDRIASMQDGAKKEHKPDIMHEDMRNLRKNDRNGKLWFIDNESGLLDAYELIYSYQQPSQFFTFHAQMLSTVCVFSRLTVDRIAQLAGQQQPHDVLVNYAQSQEPLFYKLSTDFRGFKYFKSQFHSRLKDIVNWVEHCREL